LAPCVALLLAPAVPVAAAGTGEAAAPAAETWRVEVADGGSASVQPPEVRVEGGLTFYYRDIRVTADRAIYDDRERIARFFGSVRAQRPGETVEGDAMIVRLKTGELSVEPALARLEAQGVQGPVFLQADRLGGTRDRIEAKGATLTTCPLPVDHAHYRITVSHLEVRPGEEVKAYNAVFWESGVPIFYWPLLRFSLKNPRAGRFLPPEVGYGEREGLFVKTRFPYMGPGSAYGYVNVNYFERLGPGLGLYQALYDDGASYAAVFLDGTLRGPDGFPADLSAGAEGQLSAGGGTVSGRLTLSRRESGGELRYLAQGQAGGSLPDWGFSLSSFLQGYGAVEGGGPPVGATTGEVKLGPPAQGPLRLEAGGRWDLANLPGQPLRNMWDLFARLAWRVGEGEAAVRFSRLTHPALFTNPAASVVWNSVSALPELTLTYPLARLNGLVPARLELDAGAGRFTEQKASGGVVSDSRVSAGLRLSAGPVRWKSWQLEGSGSIWGATYEGGSRQRVARASVSARWQLARSFSVRGGYQLEAPAGLSPFEFDTATYAEKFTAQATAGEGGPVVVAVGSTYDVATGRWTLLSGSAQARAGSFEGRLTAAYDMDSQDWKGVVGQLAWRSEGARLEAAGRFDPNGAGWEQVGASVRWQLPGRIALQLGALYAPPARTVERADVSLAWRVLPEWVVSMDGSWDTRLGGLLGSSVGVALDQDCRAVGLRFDPVEGRVALTYQIKAFPQSAITVGAARPGSLAEEQRWQQVLESLERPLGP
ncbi:MAG: hypothetical protein AB1609_21360, partial [Bacillota bacterium]